MPDLTPSDLQVPDTVNVNTITPVTVTVSNIGTADAGPFTVKVQDGTTAIIKQIINNLATGSSTTFTFNWKPTTTGTHTLKILTDYYNTKTESNETKKHRN